jgi:hypothetical protein
MSDVEQPLFRASASSAAISSAGIRIEMHDILPSPLRCMASGMCAIFIPSHGSESRVLKIHRNRVVRNPYWYPPASRNFREKLIFGPFLVCDFVQVLSPLLGPVRLGRVQEPLPANIDSSYRIEPSSLFHFCEIVGIFEWITML